MMKNLKKRPDYQLGVNTISVGSIHGKQPDIEYIPQAGPEPVLPVGL